MNWLNKEQKVTKSNNKVQQSIILNVLNIISVNLIKETKFTFDNTIADSSMNPIK